MLNKFREAKQEEIASLRRKPMPAPWQDRRPDFAAALRSPGNIAVIAEYKRASPSRGIIREDLSVENAVRQYLDGGASAMSVLTEERYFQGKLDYLARAYGAASGRLPLMRKDFIFDPLQVDATAATPASALLLIVRMTPDAGILRSLRERAEAYGMEAVVEIFAENDLALARDSGARIIQVNARDLDTLMVSRQACLDLISGNPPQSGEIWIAASGMGKAEHLAQAAAAGYDAALIGTALMQEPEPGAALCQLLGGKQCA